MRRIAYPLIALLLAIPLRTSFAQDALYLGTQADEKRIAGVRMTVGDSLDEAKLGEHAIFAEANPVRWLKHASLPRPELPNAFLELRGGDRLPLGVLDTPDHRETEAQRISPHLVIVPRTSRDSNRMTSHPPVRVLVRFIKRIVWQSLGSQAYQPGTLFLRNGQEIAFRAAKFSEGMALVLTDEAPRRIPLGNIAEMHMPRVSPWQTYYEQLAALSPDLSTPLMQWELIGGSRLTSSKLRSRSRKLWASPDQKDWAFDIQPAWALDPVQVRGAELYSLQVFPPEVVPLSMIDPKEIHQKSTFSVGWRPRVNSNVRGQGLTNGGNDYLSGFGVPTYSEMHFELPSSVKAFRSRLGLDSAAGSGGCARGAIHVNDVQSKPLYLGSLMIGSAESVDTDWIALKGPAGDQASLILVADPASTGRPKGADAFDIRDFVNWLEPRLQLDRAMLQAEVHSCLLLALPGGQDWSASSQDLSHISLSNHWEYTAERAGHFQTQMRSSDTFLTLRRNLQLGEKDFWLKLFVSQRDSTDRSSARLQVRLDGQAIAELEVPDRQGHGDPEPLFVSVRESQNRNAELEIVLMPGPEPGWIHWGGLQTGDFPSPLHEVFSETPVLPIGDNAEQQPVQIENNLAYSGDHCLRIESSTQLQLLSECNVSIRKHPRPGEFRYLRYAWRKQGGNRLELDLAFQPPQDAARGGFPALHHHRYQVHSSRSQPAGTTSALISKELPEIWTVVTRDLYEDLGVVQLRSLSLSCPDGEYALADHIFLARTLDDFANCPRAAEPKPIEEQQDPGTSATPPRREK